MSWFSSSKTRMKSVLTPDQQALISELTGMITPGMAVEFRGNQPSAVADLTQPQVQQFMSMAAGVGSSELDMARDESLKKLMGGQAAYEIDPEARRKVYEAQEAESLDKLRRDVLPMLEERANAGGRSGMLMGAYGNATQGLGETFRRQRAELEYRDTEAGRQAAEAGYGRMTGGVQAANASRTADLAALGGAGQWQYDNATALAQEQNQQWALSQPWMNPWLGWMGQALNPSLSPATKSQSYGLI